MTLMDRARAHLVFHAITIPELVTSHGEGKKREKKGTKMGRKWRTRKVFVVTAEKYAGNVRRLRATNAIA